MAEGGEARGIDGRFKDRFTIEPPPCFTIWSATALHMSSVPFSMPWDLGPRKAKEYLFTGDSIDAATALELGLVNRVVPRAELTIPHRQGLGTYGAAARAKGGVKDRIKVRDEKFGDAAGGS